ncbi:uncharacterized protein LOC143218532 isoform X2 [Lasioglossum baleicum]
MEIESSINRTIEEVERQLREDPRLPRLTRHDIVRFLQNITSQDLNSLKDQEKIDKARQLYQRALMVVLPYNPAESNENLNDLYTKPPMVQMIPDSLKSGNEEGKIEANRYTPPIAVSLEPEEVEAKVEQSPNPNVLTDSSKPKMKVEEDKGRKETIIDLTIPSADENLVSREPQPTKNPYKNHRETYSEVRTKLPLKESLKLDSAPVRFTFNLENLQKNAFEKTTTTTRRPVYRNNGNKNSELEIVYSTSITELPATKSAFYGVTIDHGKSKISHNVLSSSQWQYNAPPSTPLKPTMPSKFNKIQFLPTINSDPEDRPVALPTKKSEAITADSEMMEALIVTTERPTALYVTPMSTGTSSKVKYSSTYSINSAGFRAATSTTTAAPMRPEVMDLLASIGLRPDNYSNVEDVYKKNKELIENKSQIPGTNGLIPGLVSGLSSTGPDPVSILDQNTFNGPGSEIKKGVENLTPDVQLLFQRFGLQTSKLDQSTTSTERTTINFNDYTNFKPLPTSNVKDQDMKEFLAKFGLGTSDNRKQKSMKQATEPPSVVEAVPSNMRGILENMGLISTTAKPPRNTPEVVDDMESTATSTYHVFKPHEVNVSDEKQRVKINELLDTVKMVQEGKADIQNVKKIANDLLVATQTLKDGPDPLRLEEIIKTYNEDTRNEIKRQQEPETTTAATTEATTTPSTTTTTTESVEATTDSEKAASEQKDTASTKMPDVSSSSSNLVALEESFGGTTSAPDTSLPPKRKSGLYFLVDWNTFLEVGEDDKEKVNLRFQPKVGDRTRFLPVTVP